MREIARGRNEQMIIGGGMDDEVLVGSGCHSGFDVNVEWAKTPYAGSKKTSKKKTTKKKTTKKKTSKKKTTKKKTTKKKTTKKKTGGAKKTTKKTTKKKTGGAKKTTKKKTTKKTSKKKAITRKGGEDFASVMGDIWSGIKSVAKVALPIVGAIAAGKKELTNEKRDLQEATRRFKDYEREFRRGFGNYLKDVRYNLIREHNLNTRDKDTVKKLNTHIAYEKASVNDRLKTQLLDAQSKVYDAWLRSKK
jgi:hypothetical protein